METDSSFGDILNLHRVSGVSSLNMRGLCSLNLQLAQTHFVCVCVGSVHFVFVHSHNLK